MKSVAAKLLRQTKLGLLFLDWYPVNTKFYDDISRTVPRQFYRELRLWKTLVAQESNAVYSAYQGGDVIDIGAFHGVYSILLSPKGKPGDTFVSFEPDSRAFPNLLHNLAVVARCFPHLKLCGFPFPIGNGQPIQLSYPMGDAYHPQYTSVEKGDSTDASYSIDRFVELMKLRPSFIKIDVEGAEYAVLAGMQKTLAEFHPTIMLELHPQWQPPNCTVELIKSLLESHSYQSEDITHDTISVRQLWK